MKRHINIAETENFRKSHQTKSIFGFNCVKTTIKFVLNDPQNVVKIAKRDREQFSRMISRRERRLIASLSHQPLDRLEISCRSERHRDKFAHLNDDSFDALIRKYAFDLSYLWPYLKCCLRPSKYSNTVSRPNDKKCAL